MATPKNFIGANAQLKAPEGMEDSVSVLPVHLTDTESISRWRLTDDEIEQVVNTRDIWVSVMVMQKSQPPMMISGYPLIVLTDEAGNRLSYDPDHEDHAKPVRIIEKREEFDA